MTRTAARILLTIGGVLAVGAPLAAHPMTGSNATFVQSIQGPAIAPFLDPQFADHAHRIVSGPR